MIQHSDSYNKHKCNDIQGYCDIQDNCVQTEFVNWISNSSIDEDNEAKIRINIIGI